MEWAEFIFLICPSIFFSLLSMIPVLIYCLDYKPYTEIELSSGYCTNMTAISYRKEDTEDIVYIIYHYSADIYDSINGTFIGKSSGCMGTFSCSYIESAGEKCWATGLYPYESTKDNELPSWLCSYVDNTFTIKWKLIEDSVMYDDSIAWPNKWEPCKYGSLDPVKQKPYNVKSIAQAPNGVKYMNVINIYGTYTQIKNTDHYYATLTFIGLLSFITILICMFTVRNIYNKKKEEEEMKKIYHWTGIKL